MRDAQAPHCFTRIRAIYSRLSEKERSIANLILNDPERIIHSTISEIAEDLGVADATVFRFCKRIGFKGYQAMKITIASELSSPIINDIHEKITEDDDEKTIVTKVFKSNIRTLEDTLQVIDMDQFKLAVNALVTAKKTYFYGLGGSGAIAMDAHHKFIRSGLLTNCYTDSHLQIISASQLTDKDVAVGISHSGASRDIIEALDVAKTNGATTIGITHFASTPLSKMADITLFTVSEETEFRSEALASRLAQLSIIDALYVNVSVKLNNQMKTSIQKIRKVIKAKRI
jgi:RpiR family transcriptional regulator, carbohydrate utilization regulator